MLATQRHAPSRRTILAGGLSATSAAALAACGATPSGGTETAGSPSIVTGNVRFATWAVGPQAEMKEQQLRAFNESQSGVRATLESYPTSTEHWTKLQTIFAGSPEEAPEVFWQSGSFFLQ